MPREDSSRESSELSGWAIAITLPNGEKRVSEQLVDLGLPFIIFRIRKIAAYRGRLIERLVPAFPRYVFMPLTTCWEAISNVTGFFGLLSFGSAPATVRPGIVESLWDSSKNGVLPEIERPNAFKEGDRVYVLDRQAVYHHHCGLDRAVVLLDCMGRSAFVNVSECDIRSARPAAAVARKRRRRKRRNRARVPQTAIGVEMRV